jgi:hypothetical protein
MPIPIEPSMFGAPDYLITAGCSKRMVNEKASCFSRCPQNHETMQFEEANVYSHISAFKNIGKLALEDMSKQ